MGRWAAGVALAALALGTACTSSRVFQRNGCWVKQTESFPKTVKEELGPCAPATPKWSEDRVARLVQECIAESNYRFQNEALAAWNRGQPLPSRSEQAVMQQCMKNAATELITENEALRRRVTELGADRDGLAAVAQEERRHLRSSQDRMTDALGEAAKKPAPSAYATANSTGTASTQSEQRSAPGAPVNISTPAVPVLMPERQGFNPLPTPRPSSKPQGRVPSCSPASSGKRSKKGSAGKAQCVTESQLAAKEPASVVPLDQK